MELIGQSTKNLGVTQTQAEGGVGMLFNLAKGKLGGSDFSKVSVTVPGINTLMKAAPTSGGGFFSKLFGGGVGNLASLASGFSKLGLDNSMIAKFVPIVLSFVQSKGGEGVKALLEKALR